MKNETKLTTFLHSNPNATKEQIGVNLKMTGLVLFNFLKAQIKLGAITVTGEGSNATYSLVEANNEVVSETPVVVSTEETPFIDTPNEDNAEIAPEEKHEEEEAAPAVEQPTVIRSAGRNNDKYKFNGEEYGKGKLVLAVVKKYVEDNPSTTYKQIKLVFPDTLMKRFGVIADERTAKELSGKYARYFNEPIKLDDKTVLVCNQWTEKLALEFIKTAKALGYKIK